MNILVSRRNFLLGASAYSLAGCLAHGGALSGRPKLKFGVLSDIHITDWASTEILRKTFRHFRDNRVDAVMIAGDMADHGILVQLENVARAWFEVFPDDRGLDGSKVERLFIYGNHDPEGLAYRDAAMDKAFAVHHLSYEEAGKQSLQRLGLASCWERCFHEAYDPIWTKNVKGYDFIGGHWDPANGTAWGRGPAIEEWMKTNVAKINVAQPFFYFQHPHPRGTVYAGDTWGEDAGGATRALAPYANAVAFSGHSHLPLTDGRAYWRGEFTSIGAGTLSYLCMPPGRKGAKNYRENLDGRCGQIVSLYDDRMVIVRRDYFNDEDIDDAVVLEMPTKASTFSVRACARREEPRFAKDAKPALVLGKDRIDFSFPGAFANPTARPFDYEITLFAKLKGKPEGRTWRKSELYAQPEAVLSRRRAIAAGPVKGTFVRAALPADAEAVRVRVVARNCYGAAGGAVQGDWLALS